MGKNTKIGRKPPFQPVYIRGCHVGERIIFSVHPAQFLDMHDEFNLMLLPGDSFTIHVPEGGTDEEPEHLQSRKKKRYAVKRKKRNK